MLNRSGARIVLGMNWLQKPLKRLLATLLVVLLGWGVASCRSTETSGPSLRPTRGSLSEVSPPYTLQVLKQSLDLNQPQIKILSPRPNQVIGDTQVALKLQVKDLPLFKDEELGLGPYLQILLDSQPYRQVYDTREPVLLENLTPGTHTIRVLAARPWHESFKNDGAFAQITFHVFTPTAENNPDPNQPLLTYNYPQGVYGAEPVLLDFYLTNAPLHLVAREDPKDEIPDWKIRCTINGESFSFDRWEPIYLKGLKPGKNWVQLELLDDQDRLLPNVFNSSVQIVTYEPGGSDTLARLTRGELTADAARKIVDPNYVPPVIPPAPEILPEPEEAKEPEADVSQPKVAEPDTAEPDTAEPKAPEPKAVEKALEPKAVEPNIPQPSVIAPKLVAPKPADLSSPEPEEKKVAEPKGAEPKVAEPKVAEPKVIEPKLIAPTFKSERDQEPAAKSMPVVPAKPVEPLNRQPVRMPTREPAVKPEPIQVEPAVQPVQPDQKPFGSDLIQKLQQPTAPELAAPEPRKIAPDTRFQPELKQAEPSAKRREAPFSEFKPIEPPARPTLERPVAPSTFQPLKPIAPATKPALETPAFKPLPPREQPQPVKLPDLERPAPPKLVPPAPPSGSLEQPTRLLEPNNGLNPQKFDKTDAASDSFKDGFKSEPIKSDPFKAIEERLNQLLQPADDAPNSLLDPDFRQPSLPISPLEPLLEPTAPPEPAPNRPDLFGMLDRVKVFFEGLKRPAQDKPLLAPLLQPSPDDGAGLAPLEEPTIIDTLIDALPDPLRQSVLEELEQPALAPVLPVKIKD
jgi:hypothetical protein